jgi:DNA-binding GntR family transcriptional regulator
MKKKQERSLSDTTYDRIKDDIVTCAFEPGQFIAQSELAEQYQVGLTPVREALRRLTQEGFVSSLPRMGFIVSQITPQDVDEIFELRMVLENAAVRLAALRAPESTLDLIAESAKYTYLYKDRQSYTSFLKMNANFHISIAASTNNQRLAFQVSKTMDELTRVFHLGLDLRDSAEEMRQDHLVLVDALRKRDPDLAERCIRREIQLSRERVLEAIRRYPGEVYLKGKSYGEHPG